jgi:hypothetical protein
VNVIGPPPLWPMSIQVISLGPLRMPAEDYAPIATTASTAKNEIVRTRTTIGLPERTTSGETATYDGVTRYASKTASTFRSAESSARSAFTSPNSAVYQFFAS